MLIAENPVQASSELLGMVFACPAECVCPGRSWSVTEEA